MATVAKSTPPKPGLHWATLLSVWLLFAGGLKAEAADERGAIWLGLSHGASSFSKQVTREQLSEALSAHSPQQRVNEGAAVASAQWYAEQVLPITSRGLITNPPTWAVYSVTILTFPETQTRAFLIDLIPPLPDGFREGPPPGARLLVAQDGAVLDVTGRRGGITFRQPRLFSLYVGDQSRLQPYDQYGPRSPFETGRRPE